jgi:hypothetical protein
VAELIKELRAMSFLEIYALVYRGGLVRYIEEKTRETKKPSEDIFKIVILEYKRKVREMSQKN